ALRLRGRVGRHRDHHGRAVGAGGPRWPDAARHRGGQPRVQRRQLLARAHAGVHHARHRRQPRVAARHRSRHRHRPRAPAPRLRALLPRGQGPLPCHRGDRAGPGDRQARRLDPQRPGDPVEPARNRVDLHARTSGSRGVGRRRGPALRRREHGRARARRERHTTRGSRAVTRVLIVEDEASLADPLAFLLRKEGFDVTIAGDGPTALEAFDAEGADIVLLDLMLPGMSGTDVCKRLRVTSSVPVIMVTARDSEIDKVVGLELGADDYVTKPYSARELIARIRAVLRRGADVEAEQAEELGVLEAGPVRMDVERHTVTVRGDGTTLPLKEFDLLEYLLRNSGRVLTRGQLIDRVWGSDYVGDTKTLDVHVKRLRAKIEPDP